MNTKERIVEYIKSNPPFETTALELALKIGASVSVVSKTLPELILTNRIKIDKRTEGRGGKTIYSVVETN